MKTRRMVEILLIFLFLIPSTLAQDNGTCPTAPAFLNGVDDLGWLEIGHVMQFSLDEGRKNDYLQTWVAWRIDTEQLELVQQPQTLDAVRIAEELHIYDTFLSENDTSHLSLSPDSDETVYVSENRLFAVFDSSMPESVELGHLTENLDDVDIHWVSEDEIIVVVTPIYGQGFEIYHACLDAECFINVSTLVDGFASKPFVNVQEQTVHFHTGGELLTYSLQDEAIQDRVQLPVTTLETVQAIVVSNVSYFVGLDEANMDLVLYRLDLQTEVLTPLTIIDDELGYSSDWIIAPERQYAIFASPKLYVECY